ncbi:AsmA family protein [Moritella sp. F3]|uniref:AsmA family protein n=1 Tax=Moritella sp. F3 TaxID=2718882 RepID=UPI0018E158A9|nr:AsmA family protein [Moritella sp. F3]GIC78664.1 cell envelope biogenesis protein AsmA [Moritella sp. F1]GIC81408.1 cell envelope biogenesis protein AsmA [Moritella sp. F3]
MKKVLLGIGGLIAIIFIAGFIAIKFFVNEELIKDNLVKQAKQFTKQDVTIEGDLNLTFYPQIGFELGKVTLFNKHEYADSKQIEVNNVHAAVELMSLLTKTIVVTNVQVDGLTVNVETLADGRNNMDELLATLTPPAASAETELPVITNEDIQAIKVTPEGELAKSEYQFIVQGVSITNAQLSLNNRQDGTYHKLSDSSLTVGEFAFAKPVAITLAANYRTNELTAKLNTSMVLTIDEQFSEIKLAKLDNKLALTGSMLPRPEMNISLQGDMTYDNAYKTMKLAGLKLDVDELTITGDLAVDVFAKPSLEYNLAMNTLVVDDWLPKSAAVKAKDGSAATSGTAKQTATKPAPEVEPDLSALSSVNQKGSLTITQIKQGEYVLDNIKLQSELKDGVLQLTKLSSDLYEGKLMVKALLDSNKQPATFNMNSTLEKVQSEQLVTIAAGKKMLTGLVDVDVRISGKGLTTTKLKSATKGTINTSFTDGAVLGMNVAQEVRKAIAMFSKKSETTADEGEQTDFSAMVANFKLGGGKLTSTKIDLASPAIKVDGKGSANLIRENLDFTFNAAVAENIGGQSSSTMKEVRDLRLPIDVKGSFAAPSIKVDFGAITKQLAEKEKDKLMDKYLGSDEKKDELKNKIFKEFNRLF